MNSFPRFSLLHLLVSWLSTASHHSWGPHYLVTSTKFSASSASLVHFFPTRLTLQGENPHSFLHQLFRWVPATLHILWTDVLACNWPVCQHQFGISTFQSAKFLPASLALLKIQLKTMVSPQYFHTSTKFSADSHLRLLGYYVFLLDHPQKPIPSWFLNFPSADPARTWGVEGYTNDERKWAKNEPTRSCSANFSIVKQRMKRNSRQVEQVSFMQR